MLTPEQEAAFESRAPRAERIVFAPYRVCLVGAHIDHQGGVVTGFALDHGVALAYTPTDDRAIELDDALQTGSVTIGEDNVVASCTAADDWRMFALGAASLLAERKRGLRGTIAGSLPPGGLSSSAALSLTLLSAIADADGRQLTPRHSAALAVEIENRFVGVRCGLLDPTVIANARADHLVTLDCATGEISLEPGPSVAIVAIYSGVPRALVTTSFNTRTEECRAAAALIAERLGAWPGDNPPLLGDLPLAGISEHMDAIPPPYSLRARHFATEMERVRRAVEAWRAGDAAEFGRCATESCESSIANYETGTEEQTVLARILQAAPGVHGARFCGGGFGGFVAGVCDPDRASAAATHALENYRRAEPTYAEAAFSVVSHPADGLRWVR